MKIKLDSCSLIHLQQIEIIPLIVETFGSLVITDTVYHESIEIGLERKKIFAEKLQEFYTEGKLMKIHADGTLPTNLDPGEAETLAESKLEMEKGEEILCVTEDKKAKREAIRLNIDLLGVDSLLVELVLRDKLTEDQFDEKMLLLDKYHKLDLIRITELRRFIHLIKQKEEKQK